MRVVFFVLVGFISVIVWVGLLFWGLFLLFVLFIDVFFLGEGVLGVVFLFDV